ncbi:universal stress protein [Actinoplanes sp. NEAU-A12]|uniref:Universal stress protein n=1 Tax=Actinoplanes sandaracinus TaxID=3045177 RepID=A0ABT6X1L5_9ACTN|nr:universal stress protein [Actinoplanes sandaracinus]MDI6105879.1 universal stress protein [Actinoplanes sandaracinus]
MTSPHPILVGTDGSSSAQAAVRWAAVEAQRRGLPLTVLHTYDETWPTMPGLSRRVPAPTAEEQAEELAAQARIIVQTTAPTVTVHVMTVPGDPAAVLLQHAATATMVVVGHRGRGGLTSLLLGSVSGHVATQAPHSAVVVRGRATASGDPVVVGVDSSPAGRIALEDAFAVAALRHSALLAVHAYRDPLPPVVPGLPIMLPAATSALETSAADEIDELLAPLRREFPAVPVEARLVPGSAAQMLVDASHQAQLVVVGNRGSHPWTGSIGMQLLHHAGCPVMIARR